MSVPKIEKLDQLLGLQESQTVQGYKIKRLTEPGENYGSLMLSIDVTVKSPHGVEELKTVAKMVPPSDFIQELFNTQVTFRNEIGFYKHIVPLLRNFQKEHDIEKVINFFPKYYGSRLNLHNDDNAKVDSDAALVLENLKVRSFYSLEKTEGFDLEVAKLILTDMAQLHAVPLALKLQKPQVFDAEIQPFLSFWTVNDQMHEKMKADLYQIIDRLDELKLLRDRFKTSFNNFHKKREPREPFATITHNDIWVNNTMIRLENGRAVESKLVDFQVCDYGSPAKDVLFFLFSSVKTEVMKQHYDDLVRFYYETFISTLAELACDVSQFSFEAFLKEMDFEAKNSQLGHIAFMLFPIFAPRGTVKDVSELDMNTLGNTEPTNDYKEKLVFVCHEFAKRNWI